MNTVKSLLTFSFSAFVLSPAFADLAVSTPEKEGVPSEAILKWIDACETQLDALHGFTIVRHGKVIAEGSWAPYSGNVPHQLWSHSKGFTSAAVGLLADDGLLDLDERVADIFPESLPANPSQRLLSVRVRDLLTMNYGCDQDHQLKGGGDWVRQTLAKELVRDPGRGFRYDSDCTYLLAAIVERKSGRKMMDLLQERLFRPMGVEGARSNVSPQGVPCGGWGMFMKTRDLAKYGQLFLQNGRWEDRQLLSTNWVRLATADHTSCGWGGKNFLNGGDWNCGYGFQFWRCTHGAYRNDGANGQYTIVIPGQDAVISVTAGLGDMRKEIDLVWNELVAAFSDNPLPENKEALKRLRARTGSLQLTPVAGIEKGGEKVLGRTYTLAENSRGVKSVRVDRSVGGWVCTMETACGVQHFPIKYGKWRAWRLLLSKQPYESLGSLVGERPIASSGAIDAQGDFVGRVYFTDLTARLDFTLTPTNLIGGFSFGAVKLESTAVTEPVPQPEIVDFELKPTEKSLIRCRLFLPHPSQWDGRLWGTGNGGEAGIIDNGTMRTVINAFGQKTAVVNTDLGSSDHRGVNCPEVWDDFGWRATHLMTVEAKRRVRERYGKSPSKCYFYGLSTGGAQGFHEAQQFPDDYDGIVSCVPALGRMTLASLGRWCYLQAHDEKGNLLFTAEQARTLADAGLAWLNGRVLGWSEDAAKAVLAEACRRDPSLADPELSKRILAIWRGPTLADGTRLCNGIAFGVDPWCMMGWRGFQWGWHPDLGKGKNWLNTDEATYLKAVRELGTILNAENPDLSAFAGHGGKYIAFAGLEDHIVPYPSVVDYWERAAVAAGGEAKLDAFFRLYLIPTLRHGSDLCYSTLQDIVAWVEQDKAPGELVARENDEWATEHIVKPYPQGVERPLVVPTDPRLRTFLPRPSVRADGRKLYVADYRDKMEGAWIGQSVGVAYGAPTEFQAKGEILPTAKVKMPTWKPEMINGTFDQDDLYVEMTFMRTLEQRGIDVSTRLAGVDFANSRYRLWCANCNARNNLRKGIAAPWSSDPRYHPSTDDIDYQIEADFSGILSPGMPVRVIKLGNQFGLIMNRGDGLFAGQFIGGMYAEAYFETNRIKVVEGGLKCIHPASKYAEMVRDMLQWHEEDPVNWSNAWQKAVAKYQSSNYVGRVTWKEIDVKINGAMVLLGLLWGDGDIEKTLYISTAGGYDSDCNPSSAVGVLGAMLGAKAFGEKYVGKLDRTRKWAYTDYTYPGLLATSEKLTRQLVLAEGGTIAMDEKGEYFLIADPEKYSAAESEEILYLPGGFGALSKEKKVQ